MLFVTCVFFGRKCSHLITLNDVKKGSSRLENIQSTLFMICPLLQISGNEIVRIADWLLFPPFPIARI